MLACIAWVLMHFFEWTERRRISKTLIFLLAFFCSAYSLHTHRYVETPHVYGHISGSLKTFWCSCGFFFFFQHHIYTPNFFSIFLHKHRILCILVIFFKYLFLNLLRRNPEGDSPHIDDLVRLHARQVEVETFFGYFLFENLNFRLVEIREMLC